MRATVIYCRNPFDPSRDRDVKAIGRRRRIEKLAPRTAQPFICLLNGQPLLRANKGWHKSVKDGDVLAFVLLPAGGGGSNPLKVIMMIAIAVVAPQLGFSIASSLGPGALGAFGSTSALGAFIGGAIGFVGRALVNALIPDPRPPSSSPSLANTKASPTYTITGQGNAARIGEAIPVLYGQHPIYPDFAAEPYTEFAGNEQYLYQLFCIGQGEYQISNIRIEDTSIGSFDEVTTEIVQPGAQVGLFPVNVITSSEVSGQELLTNNAVGPFIINSPGTQANVLAVDVVCPKGLFYANDDGGLNKVSVTFKVEARQVDDSGSPLTSYAVLGTHTISGATGTPIRKSYRYNVTKARYQMRVTRTDTKQTNSRYGHDIMWTSARAYLPGAQQYGNVTLLAMRIRASNNLSSQTARRVNLTATRKLPIWNGSSWSAPTATRSIAWALADALRADYGGKMPDSRIDLDQLLALDAIWTSRNDYFDGIFDQKIVLWEAIGLIARAGRAKHYMQGGMVHFVRDQAETTPVALFNMRNIQRGSLRVEYLTPGDETADSVIVEYYDPASMKPLEVTAQLPGYGNANPARVQLFGVIGREQAWREGRYTAAANRYRRQVITFTTEMEGFIPSLGDLIAISHDRMRRSTSGDVVAYDDLSQTMTLTEPVAFGGGAHYVALRRRDGSYSGPWLVTAGTETNQVVLDAALDFTPDTGTSRERTSFVFGEGEAHTRLARVSGIRPRSLLTVEISAVNEDAAVHTADTGTVPPVSTYWNLPAAITVPVVDALDVTLGGTANTPLILVQWQPAPGANNYYIEVSYDAGETWQRMGDVASSDFSFPARRGQLRVRVAGVGLSRGPWAEWIGDPYAQPPADLSSFLVSAQPDGTRQFTMAMPGGVPPDFSGYQIRYKLGTGPYGWNDLVPLHDGLVTVSPWETNQLAAGEYTFACKAVDDAGNVSINAIFITADLADPRLAGVIFNVQPHTQGWPGTKTDCVVATDNNNLVATDLTTWNDLPTWDNWTQWVLTPANPIIYEHTTIDLGAPVPFVPLVSAIANGTVTLEEQHSDDDITYSSWAAMSGQIVARYMRIRATVSGSLPILRLMDIKLNGGATSEEINDLDTSLLAGSYRIGVGDIRVPIQKSYSIITQVQIALQNVGSGWSWEIIDKDVAVGPRIRIYNGAGALADATIDVFIRGY